MFSPFDAKLRKHWLVLTNMHLTNKPSLGRLMHGRVWETSWRIDSYFMHIHYEHCLKYFMPIIEMPFLDSYIQQLTSILIEGNMNSIYRPQDIWFSLWFLTHCHIFTNISLFLYCITKVLICFRIRIAATRRRSEWTDQPHNPFSY